MKELVQAIQSFHNHDLYDYLLILSSIISVGILFFTYRLALSINKKIDKPIVEKQLNTVYDLITSLQETSIEFIKINNNNGTGLSKPIKFKFFKIKLTNFDKEWLKCEIVFNKPKYKNLKFIEFKDNPFLPGSIANRLEMISFDERLIEKKDLAEGETFISIEGISNLFPFEGLNAEYYKVSLNEVVKFNEYVLNLLELQKSIIKWLDNPRKELNLK